MSGGGCACASETLVGCMHGWNNIIKKYNNNNNTYNINNILLLINLHYA